VTRPAAIRRALHRTAAATKDRWPARITVATTSGLMRVQIFDRSMTIAAQAFTSIFPTLILLSALLGRGLSTEVANLADLPDASRQILDEALSGKGAGAFGVAGAFVVLISATSLSRALARAYGMIWQLPRQPGGLAMSWRWLATVLLLVAFLVGTRLLGWLTERLPMSSVSSAVILLAADCMVAVLVPWLVLGGAVSARLLLPGGCLFGLAMLVLRPVGAVFLPRALNTSGERYGPIGHAFTYVGWLYVLAFALLATAVLGHVIATDDGAVGRLVRGPRP
jgi:membrane protein